MNDEIQWAYVGGVTASPYCERVYESKEHGLEMIIKTTWKGEGYEPGEGRTFYRKIGTKKLFKTIEEL